MLAVRCELLLGSYQAADPFGRSDDFEWPPHPYRLHAALVGAACEAGGEAPADASLDALRWLERQKPPTISCSERPSARTVATAWVPRNPTRGAEWARYAKQGTAINRVPRTFPTAIPASPVVTFEWPEVSDAPPALHELIESISWLGSSRSPVACALLADERPGVLTTDSEAVATFRPGLSSRYQVRVAGPGITDDLVAARFIHPQSLRPPIAGYEPHGDASDGSSLASAQTGAFGGLLVRRVVGATQDAADSALIGAALRMAVLAQAGDDAPPALHGHESGRLHAAYLTLADVGHTGARGTVMGVGLALPGDISPDERQACESALAAVDPLRLGGGRAPLKLDDALDGPRTLAPERWIGPAREWATVTPVILDRFPRRGRTPRDELLATLSNAGCPEPAELELLAGPPLAGAPVAGSLRGEVPPGMRVHARVRFAEPIYGPLVAGRGRFRGVGCFLPVRERLA